jgi:hypothetical protein
MSEPNGSKLNRLLGTLGDTTLVSSRWLRTQGYPSNLVARYVSNGWLRSPARGVYLRKNGLPTWEGLVHCLQFLERLPVHVGGRFALLRHGHEHHLRLGEAAAVSLYGTAKLPSWSTKLPLREGVLWCGRGPFGWPNMAYDPETSDAELIQRGLALLSTDTRSPGLVFSTPERAILELCDEKPSSALVYEINDLLRGLGTLRPKLLSHLLQHCSSVKAKRLFLALAARNRPAWWAHLELAAVDLGSGKRMLIRGGRLDTQYQISLPADLDEHVG